MNRCDRDQDRDLSRRWRGTWREYLFLNTGPRSRTRTVVQCAVAAVVIPVGLVVSVAYFAVGLAVAVAFFAGMLALPWIVLRRLFW